MPELLGPEIQKQVRDFFVKLKEPVHLLFFGSQENCEYCTDTLQLATELVALSDKLTLEAHDLQADADLARQFHIDKAPTLVIAGKQDGCIMDYGIRLAGIPSGHEFTSLVQLVNLVSSRDSGLSQPTRNFLKGLTTPLHLQVFTTPT